MAIVDNENYVLSGVQIKDLTEKVLGTKGKAKVLTTEDFNYPSDSPTKVAAWLLEDGLYVSPRPGVPVYWGPMGESSQCAFIKISTKTAHPNNMAILFTNPGLSSSESPMIKIIQMGEDAQSNSIINVLTEDDIAHDLTTTSLSKVLGARQGKILKDLIDGLSITVDGKQDLLTAGDNITIEDESGDLVISAADTTYNSFVGTDGTAAGQAGLVPAPATTDAGKMLGANGTWVTGGPSVVQTTGTSTTGVMSQKATTRIVYPDYQYNPDRIAIGDSAATGGASSVAIGSSAQVSYGATNGVAVGTMATALQQRSVAIGGGPTNSKTIARGEASLALGYSASAGNGAAGQDVTGAVAIGASSLATQRGEMNIGSQNPSYGYNSSNYRLLTGLYDPQSAHDAATKGYVDTSLPATFTTNEWNAIWA